MKSIKIAGLNVRIETIFKENEPAFALCRSKPDLLFGPDFYASVSIDEILRESTLLETNMRDAELVALCRQILENLADHYAFLIKGDIILIHQEPFLILERENEQLEMKNLVFKNEKVYSQFYALIHLYYGKILVSDFPLVSRKITEPEEIPLKGILIPSEVELNHQELVTCILNHMYLPESLKRMVHTVKIIEEFMDQYPLIQINDISKYEEIYRSALSYYSRKKEYL